MQPSMTLGPLRVRQVVKRTGAPGPDGRPLTCVFLHGFGAPGDDLVSLAEALDVPASTRFVFPEAPLSLQDFGFEPWMGDARAWWLIDVAAMERAILRGELRDLREQVPEGLAEARAAVVAMLDALGDEAGGGRVVLGGFSQGAMLALDVALHQPERPLAGLVLLSGTFLAEREWSPRMAARRATPVFQSHGDADPILPFGIAEELKNALTAAGLEVSFDPFAGGHTILPSTMARLSAWLRALP